MHGKRPGGSVAKQPSSWFRWSVVIYAVVGAAIAYNFAATLSSTSSTPPTPRPRTPRAPRQTSALLTKDTASPETVAPGAAELLKENNAPVDSTAISTFSALSHCFDVDPSAKDGTSVLCLRHLRHLAAVASTVAEGSNFDALKACHGKGDNCAAAIKGAVSDAAFQNVTVQKFLSSPTIEATWRDARSIGEQGHYSKPLRAVTAKYSPVLWHNLLSWSPQVTAAAFRDLNGDRDPYDDRKSWRHGKREPGVHSKLTDNIIARPKLTPESKPCEEEIPASRFAPFSETIRVLFEGELALQEQQLTTNETKSFSPVSSFHTVWAFPGPRKCALDRLKGASHPAITTSSVTAFGPNQAWIGYIDNTTGLTEATDALRRIVSSSAEGKSWVDFVWKSLPSKSPSLARHLIRALSTYNPWMGLTAFTSCAHVLSGLQDTPVVDLSADAAATHVVVPAPLASYSMASIADCSSNPVFPAAEECHMGPAAQDYAHLFSVKDDRSNAIPDGRRVIGALPRLLCLLTVGIDLQSGSPQRGGLDSAFRGYHSVAADYERLVAGGCTRTMLVISIAANAELVKSAQSFRAQNHRTIVTRAEDGDALLRMFNIDVLADFPLINRDDDIHITVETSVPCPVDDRAWHTALRNIILGSVTTEMRSTNAFRESFRYADGVPRHGDKLFFDLIAIIPEGVAFIPVNLHRFLTRRDSLASSHVMHIPRLYAHPKAATPTKLPTPAHRFMMIDVHMFVLLHTTLGVKTCPISETDPVFDTWRCVRRLRLKVTNPTEDGKSLMLPAATGLSASPFAIASIDKTELDVVRRWAKDV